MLKAVLISLGVAKETAAVAAPAADGGEEVVCPAETSPKSIAA